MINLITYFLIGWLTNYIDATSVTDANASPVDQTPATPTETEKPFLILGLNPKNYNDWITVVLYSIIGYQTFQIVGEIYAAVTAPKS